MVGCACTYLVDCVADDHAAFGVPRPQHVLVHRRADGHELPLVEGVEVDGFGDGVVSVLAHRLGLVLLGVRRQVVAVVGGPGVDEQAPVGAVVRTRGGEQRGAVVGDMVEHVFGYPRQLLRDAEEASVLHR